MNPRTTERPNTIALQWDGKFEEGRAQGEIYPGMALEVTTDEAHPQQFPIGVKANSIAGSALPVRIAIEDRLGNIANTILGKTIETAYAADDLVPYVIPNSGDILQVRVAQNSNFAMGAPLKLHTDGTFIAHGGTGTLVAMVAEAFNWSTGKDSKGVTNTSNTRPLLRVQFN